MVSTNPPAAKSRPSNATYLPTQATAECATKAALLRAQTSLLVGAFIMAARLYTKAFVVKA